MADSIHDQWPTATDEWPRVTAQFNAAWVSIYADYDVNTYYAAFAAGIGYLSRMLMDTSVMEGDMITHLAQTDLDNTRGLIQNFQNLQRHVLPQWGAVAAQYADERAVLRQHQLATQVQAWIAVEAAARALTDAQEAAARLAGDQLEAQQRGLGDAHSRQQAAALVQAEATARAAGDDHTRQQMAAAIKALNDQLSKQINDVLKYAQSIPGTIDQRAAAGYDPTLRDRASLVTKLLDTVVAHNPAVRELVTNLAKFAIDLAGIEDPVLKIAAQLVLKQVINHLGVDSTLSAMLNDLLGGILGGGQPKTLQAIMGDIGNRLDKLEAGQAELSPLAPEADQLHEMGTLIFDATLLAYFAAAVAEPVATANDTVAVLDAVTGPLLAPIRSLLGM